MRSRSWFPWLGAIVLALAWSSPATAQPLGTFRWQLQPYCNIVSMTVVQQGAQYQLDGTDDQCGAGQKASVNGLAFLNPDGTIGFGLTVVPPGGVPVHVDATISLGTFSGTWRDSSSVSGAFVFTPGAGTGGLPRPAVTLGDVTAVTAGAGLSGGGPSGALALAVDFAATQQRVSGTCPTDQLMTAVNQDGTVICQAVAGAAGGDITGVTAGTGLTGGGPTGDIALAVNFATTQQRVTGACPANQLMTAVNQDGTVACQSVTAAGGGDITAVTAGTGLTGGGPVGDVALAVDFASTGIAPTAARSDHTHALSGTGNTAAGSLALSLNAGFFNTALGSSALTGNTSGSNNTAVGSSTLPSSTSGSNNTALGAFALTASTTGFGNTALGYGALSMSSIASGNTAVGELALATNTADRNVAVGRNALRLNTTGAENVAVGDSALMTSTTADFGTAVGANALSLNTTGASNTAVGARALQNNVTSGHNTAVGSYALAVTTDGHNTAVGSAALAGNTTGTQNTAVGSYAMSQNTTALYNTAVGFYALASTSTGSDNTAVGRYAMAGNATGAANTAVGAGALGGSDGSNNVAIGFRALYWNAASNNTAIGHSALGLNTNGTVNTAVGRNALDSNTEGHSNTALGDSALASNVSGTTNTAVGVDALSENASGSHNVVVGHVAGIGLVSGSSNIYIGTGVGAATPSESGTTRIGNSFTTATFIRGISGATSSGGIGVFVNASGQLGTATSSARFKDAIAPLGDSLRAKVQSLTPVSFLYKPAFDDGSQQVQDGLIAEEVARTFPELLVRDAEGRPQTVRYHLLTPLLLAEVQRLERERDALEARVRALEDRLRTTAPR